MDGNNEQDRDRVHQGVDYSAAEGDGDRGRYSMLRCASQSSLDESSQRPAGGEPDADPPPVHAGRLLDALARLRRDRALCDVVIQAQVETGSPCAGGCGAGEDGGVPAHRAVLAAASPYFLAMFTQFDERTRPVITIQNIEPHALEAIIEYIYTPESLVITEDNVQSLLAGASLVAVWGVRAACCVFLAGALAPDNVLGVRAFAELHACADLALAAARYIDLHCAEVLESEEFLALESDVLCQLLDSDRITVPNEEVILDAVIRWMQHDPEKRQGSLGAVLEHVRLPQLPQDVLVARATAEPLLSADIRVKDLVIEALSFHLVGAGARAPGRAGGRAPRCSWRADRRPRPCARSRRCTCRARAGGRRRRCRGAVVAPGWRSWAGACTPWAASTGPCACAAWTCTTWRATPGRPGRRCWRAAPRWAWPSSGTSCTRWAASTASRASARPRRWTRARRRRPGGRWRPCPRAAPAWAWARWAAASTPWAATTAPPASVCTPSRGSTLARARGSRARPWLRGARGRAWARWAARCTPWAGTTAPPCDGPSSACGWQAPGRAAGSRRRPCTRSAATLPSSRTAAGSTSSAATTAPPTWTPSRCSTRPRRHGRCSVSACLWAARTRAWPSWTGPPDAAPPGPPRARRPRLRPPAHPPPRPPARTPEGAEGADGRWWRGPGCSHTSQTLEFNRHARPPALLPPQGTMPRVARAGAGVEAGRGALSASCGAIHCSRRLLPARTGQSTSHECCSDEELEATEDAEVDAHEDVGHAADVVDGAPPAPRPHSARHYRCRNDDDNNGGDDNDNDNDDDDDHEHGGH